MTSATAVARPCRELPQEEVRPHQLPASQEEAEVRSRQELEDEDLIDVAMEQTG
eukprot:CAMPEP_0185901444 /NCGR_PEP_ID=MMETSP0196C-20130402/803_1 /TAXON_ID=2932 /ORGANISM="Alexandrium fundyense, Strain CCMP1719" /LENGTH=53 /DNA_ID=CAMNT_0028620099 /DNA_START=30 /DNA_END=189 /DNA_ORIENTATION=+